MKDHWGRWAQPEEMTYWENLSGGTESTDGSLQHRRTEAPSRTEETGRQTDRTSYSAGTSVGSSPAIPLAATMFFARRPTSYRIPFLAILLSIIVFASQPTYAIKFSLPGYRYPPAKCIWNSAHTNALVIVTANVGPGAGQRVDVEIIDSSPQKNVYLSKKNVNGETRLAVTAHVEGEVGVCFRNYLDYGVFGLWRLESSTKLILCMQTYPRNRQKPHLVSSTWTSTLVRTQSTISVLTSPRFIRLIIFTSLFFSAIANQESLSGLETEMRKLEGVVKEIVDELGYLTKREERFQDTNSAVPHSRYFL